MRRLDAECINGSWENNKIMRQYIVDAFTDTLFHGNQAAVCVMNEWISDELMQDIARENNFSETAFTVKEGEDYHLRWFTPGGEIDFCGHATLGTSFVLFNFYEKEKEEISFITQVGKLSVKKENDEFVMDMPAYNCHPVQVTKEMERAIGVKPLEAYKDRDLMMVLETEEQVRNLTPDFDMMKSLEGVTISVTAPGREYDSVSRCFAPELSIAEDPVTGSTHCMIAPYWSKKLGKKELNCYQASERGGNLRIKVLGERVEIAGKAVLYAVSELHIGD